MARATRREAYELLGAAFAVYNAPPYRMPEEARQQALDVERALWGIPFAPKRVLRASSKERRPDLWVCSAIVVEWKGGGELVADHFAQLFNDMRIADVRIARRPAGCRLTFGPSPGLERKRLILSELPERNT